jgi:hypothetical protein
MADRNAEVQRITLLVLAAIEDTNLAEQRRRAVGDRVERALRNPDIASAVQHILNCIDASRGADRSNVVQMAGRRR